MGQEQSAFSSGDDAEQRTQELRNNARELEKCITELTWKEREQIEDSDRIFNEFDLWTAACRVAGQNFQDKFRGKLVNAFHKLADVVKLVLGAPDGHLNHTGNAHIVASILETKTAFDELLETSKSALNSLSDESQEAFVEEATVYKKIDSLKQYEIQTKSSYEASKNAADATLHNLQEAKSSLCDAERRLHQRVEELDNFFDNTFTDKSPILCHFEASVGHEAARVEHYRACAELNETLCHAESQILDHLLAHIHRLEKLMEKMQEEEHSIIHAKEASSELFSKIYDMEICFKSRNILVDKTDLLRHILQALHVTIVQDSDEYPSIKAAIYQHFSDHMTSEEIRDLEETKDYLVMEI